MTPLKALVVEDDDRVIPSIEDTLVSLGHEYEWVTNQADAHERLVTTEFDYLLVDLQIPARANRGGASTEFGLNLLRSLREANGTPPPVIIMTAFATSCVDMTRELMLSGATDFIAKPFPEQGRTLAEVIRRAIGSSARAGAGADVSWLTVKQCADLLALEISGLDAKRAMARVSRAASAEKFRTNGIKGAARRIDRDSFSNWRIRQRDRDLAGEDERA